MPTPDQVQFRYEKVGKTRIRADRRALSLLFRILKKNTRRGLRLAGATPAQLLRHCARIVKNQIRAGRHQDDLYLAIDGDLCRSVHGGYKVFDFRSMTVTKIFSDEVSSEARKAEIEGVSAAAALSFAPEFRDVAEDLAWYSESLVGGTLGPKSRLAGRGRFRSEFAQQIYPILDEMLRIRPVRAIEIRVRVSQIEDQLREANFPNRFPSGISFTDSILSSLDSVAGSVVLTAFSHGDFGLVNIVDGGSRLHVIDWESAAYRTLLNDFFNALFVECYYDRMTLAELNADLGRAVDGLADYLSSGADLSESIRAHASAYRRLYYLERLVFLLEREPSESSTRVIERSLRLFASFERQSERLATAPQGISGAAAAREAS